ncbi:TIR domain-containing protein [Lysinibacillus fusiformis]|uniref:TIR domain-containing protein n=1 Tax=Lysinibacillus fusiformis TaxID=28031 RepID=UPI001E38D7D1|nr:TIR domain-containing protein [Lysinibacillus fusiformis]MCE4045577.1 TIR domain-containing protein [Lysinibacillus fusiformis]
MVKRKCFISFKTEDMDYKEEIAKLDLDLIDKSLKEPINSEDEDYIMRKIREDYLKDSTVTIFIIGTKSNEYLGWTEQKYIKRELQASLFNGEGNSRNGILGIVLPTMYDSIYRGQYECTECEAKHTINYVNIDDSTTIKEFNYNYYFPNNGNCCYTENDRYCVLVKWGDFILKPSDYIEKAFEKRGSDLAKKVKVRP